MIFALALGLFPVFAQTAYVGVADVGTGRGALGHVFLVVTGPDGSLTKAAGYQFAVDVPASREASPRTLFDLGRYPFTLTLHHARALVDRYVNEDRAVVLYEVRASAAEVRAIQAAAESERRDRAVRPRRDFSLAHNCATATFDLINEGLGESAFAHAPPLGLLNGAGLRRDAGAWLSVPITAGPRLARHPRVRGRRVFPPRSAETLRVVLTAIADLRPLFEACGTSPAARALVGRALANESLRDGARYLAGFRELTAACARTRGLAEVYNQHLDVLDFLTRDADQRARIKREYL